MKPSIADELCCLILAALIGVLHHTNPSISTGLFAFLVFMYLTNFEARVLGIMASLALLLMSKDEKEKS